MKRIAHTTSPWGVTIHYHEDGEGGYYAYVADGPPHRVAPSKYLAVTIRNAERCARRLAKTRAQKRIMADLFLQVFGRECLLADFGPGPIGDALGVMVECLWTRWTRPMRARFLEILRVAYADGENVSNEEAFAAAEMFDALTAQARTA